MKRNGNKDLLEFMERLVEMDRNKNSYELSDQRDHAQLLRCVVSFITKLAENRNDSKKQLIKYGEMGQLLGSTRVYMIGLLRMKVSGALLRSTLLAISAFCHHSKVNKQLFGEYHGIDAVLSCLE